MTLMMKPITITIRLDEGVQPPEIHVPIIEDIPAGTLLRLEPDSFHVSSLIVERIVLEDGTACEEVTRYSDAEVRKNWATHVQTAGLIVVKIPRDISKGESVILNSVFGSIDYTNGDEPKRYTNEPTRPYFAEMEWSMILQRIESVSPDSRKTPVSPEIKMAFEPGAPTGLKAIWKADGWVHIRHFDRNDNPTPVDSGSVTIVDPSGKSSEEVSLQSDSASNKHRAEISVPQGSRFEVNDSLGNSVLSNAVPVTHSGQKVCFGEFHWHTDLSCDGTRSLPRALKTAKDEICLDFAGPGDHIWSSGDFGPNATPEMQADALREIDNPGEFAVLPGAEFSCHIGHANFYCDTIDRYLKVCSRLPAAAKAATTDPKVQYQWDILTGALIPEHTFLVPHHSNTNSFDKEGVVRADDGRPFWNSMNFPRGPELPHVRLMEIYQIRGSFEDETTDNEWRIFSGGYGASARSALMKGYRIGFTGGTDNHNGWPSRHVRGGKIDGFTAVLTDSIDTQSIWQALNERRCYATTGARIICDVTLNGHPIGSELKLARDASRKIDIRIYGTAPLEKVEIISAGIVLDSVPIPENSWDLETEWEDTRPGRPLQDVYYYLRILQKDGNIAWLSPFWIDAEG